MTSHITFYIVRRCGEPILDCMNSAVVWFERLVGVEETIVCTACACNMVIVPHLRSVRCPQCGAVIEHNVL